MFVELFWMLTCHVRMYYETCWETHSCILMSSLICMFCHSCHTAHRLLVTKYLYSWEYMHVTVSLWSFMWEFTTMYKYILMSRKLVGNPSWQSWPRSDCTCIPNFMMYRKFLGPFLGSDFPDDGMFFTLSSMISRKLGCKFDLKSNLDKIWMFSSKNACMHSFLVKTVGTG